MRLAGENSIAQGSNKRARIARRSRLPWKWSELLNLGLIFLVARSVDLPNILSNYTGRVPLWCSRNDQTRRDKKLQQKRKRPWYHPSGYVEASSAEAGEEGAPKANNLVT